MSVVEGLPFADNKKKYIVETLDPILEEMVSDVLTDLPDDPNAFMISWLCKRCGQTPGTGKQGLQERNTALKRELNNLKEAVQEAGSAIKASAGAADADAASDEEDDDDECDEIPESMKKPDSQMTKARASVSAEAYGQWNQKKAFTPPVHPKSDEQKQRLMTTLNKSFMFACLESNDMTSIVLAMKEVPLATGEKVIQEGDDGDFLFVIEKGELDCVKKIDGADKVVKTCSTGDVFGELALLYNCPRAATVVAKESCVCWQLDRETFNHIVKDAASKKRVRYENFLKKVTILATIDAYDRSQIADALVPEVFKKGDIIVKQDEPGDKFYIVEEGALYATKGVDRVMDYGAGDYFGELALLRNQPRAASVVVESDEAKILTMSRMSFSKMLGPLTNLLAGKQYN